MGLGDKFKDFKKQAQETVAEHKDQIHDAVDAAGLAADRRTRGKHSARIAKLGQKAGAAVDRFAGTGYSERPPESAAGTGYSERPPESAAQQPPESAAQQSAPPPADS